MIAAGVAAAALAGRAIVRAAQRGGPSAGAGFFQSFAKMGGGAEKGFETPMSRGEAAKILGIRYSNAKFSNPCDTCAVFFCQKEHFYSLKMVVSSMFTI